MTRETYENIRNLDAELYQKTSLHLIDIGVVPKSRVIERAIMVCGADSWREIVDYLQNATKEITGYYIERDGECGRCLYPVQDDDLKEIEQRVKQETKG